MRAQKQQKPNEKWSKREREIREIRDDGKWLPKVVNCYEMGNGVVVLCVVRGDWSCC